MSSCIIVKKKLQAYKLTQFSGPDQVAIRIKLSVVDSVFVVYTCCKMRIRTASWATLRGRLASAGATIEGLSCRQMQLATMQYGVALLPTATRNFTVSYI